MIPIYSNFVDRIYGRKSNFQSLWTISRPDTTSPPSLPDLIRQSIFSVRIREFLDPRIKSGGDE